MGTPKALLPFGDRPLITHIVATLRGIFEEIVVVASPDQSLPQMDAAIVRDEVAYQGPVGGLYYGLKGTRRDVSFVTSCDSAFLNDAVMSYLVTQIGSSDAAVPHWKGRLQPLHAVYRRTVLPVLHSQLARGELRLAALFDTVPTRRITESELRHLDPAGLSFFNMNTPDDYAEALAQWRKLHGRDGAGPSRGSSDGRLSTRRHREWNQGC